MRKKWLFPFILLLLLLTGCQQKQRILQDPYEKDDFLMGTYVKIKVYDEGKKDALAPAIARIKDLAGRITVNQKGSEVDKVNENAGIKPVKVSKEVFELAERAYQMSADSDGGFDLAIGPITSLWHIGFDDARKPSQAEIDQALQLVDYRQVKLDKKAQTIYLEKAGMKLDFGAIAKGFITDEVIKVLKKHKVTTAIVDLGGNVYVLGDSPRGTAKNPVPWNVGIQDPNQARNVIVGTVPAANKTLVTSGIYERYLKVDGKIYHHLFDPQTGYPFDNDIAGVTIVAKKSEDGDALSTAVFSMGTRRGLSYINHLDGVEAIFVTKDDKIYLSNGLKKTFALEKKSGYKMGDPAELK